MGILGAIIRGVSRRSGKKAGRGSTKRRGRTRRRRSSEDNDSDLLEYAGEAQAGVEEAVEEALYEMEGMLGNEGQTAIFEDYQDVFIGWANDVEDGGEGLEGWMNAAGMDPEKWEGTSEIWTAGEDIVLEAVDEAQGFSEESDDTL